MLASVPERWAGTPTGSRSWRAYQYTELPTSTATCALAGRRLFSSKTTRSGLIGSAGVWARRSANACQSRTLYSICRRHVRLVLTEQRQQRAQGAGGITHQRYLDRVSVADLAAVDVDLYRTRRAGRWIELGPRVV